MSNKRSMINKSTIIILSMFGVFSLCACGIALAADFSLSQDSVSSAGGNIASTNTYFTMSSFGDALGGAMSSSDFKINAGSSGALPPEPGSKIIPVKGSVSDNYQIDSVVVTVNQTQQYPAQINANEYSVDVSINEGPNTILSTAKDKAGNSTTTPPITVYLDTIVPLIPVINTPLTPTYELTQTLSGIKEKGTSIWINNQEKIPANDSSSWSYELALNEGENNILIFSKDKAGNQSPAVSIPIFVDRSAPTITKVTDDGDITYDRKNLHCTWQGSYTTAPIVEYQYAIGITQGQNGTDVVGWASTGLNTEVTHNFAGIQLVPNTTYYFNIKAKNILGLWSEVGSSDGITVKNKSPEITKITTSTGENKFTEGNLIEVSIESYDPEMDNYQIRYLVDGVVLQDWDYNKTFKWQTKPGDIRAKTITAEVMDDYGDKTSKDLKIFLFRKAPKP